MTARATNLAAEGVVGAGPDGQRVHTGVAAAAAGDGGGVAAGLPPPARPLVAPHQVGDPCRERGDNMSGMILWQSKGVISCVRQSDVDDWNFRWEAWALRASSPRGLPFRGTLHMLLRARLGLSVSAHPN